MNVTVNTNIIPRNSSLSPLIMSISVEVLFGTDGPFEIYAKENLTESEDESKSFNEMRLHILSGTMKRHEGGCF